MDIIDKKLLRLLANNISKSLSPYKDLADQLNITEDEVLKRLEHLSNKGYLKRIAPILYHHKTRYQYNALTAWDIPREAVDDFAEVLMSIPNISHVYERRRHKNWPYNVYGMLHCSDEQSVTEIIDQLIKASHQANYKVIYTKKEWKKTSPNLNFLLK
jgi:DNA-binding Lrp family transcriptional regulator